MDIFEKEMSIEFMKFDMYIENSVNDYTIDVIEANYMESSIGDKVKSVIAKIKSFIKAVYDKIASLFSSNITKERVNAATEQCKKDSDFANKKINAYDQSKVDALKNKIRSDMKATLAKIKSTKNDADKKKYVIEFDSRWQQVLGKIQMLVGAYTVSMFLSKKITPKLIDAYISHKCDNTIKDSDIADDSDDQYELYLKSKAAKHMANLDSKVDADDVKKFNSLNKSGNGASIKARGLLYKQVFDGQFNKKELNEEIERLKGEYGNSTFPTTHFSRADRSEWNAKYLQNLHQYSLPGLVSAEFLRYVVDVQEYLKNK